MTLEAVRDFGMNWERSEVSRHPMQRHRDRTEGKK
jgi:hypothetical protein